MAVASVIALIAAAGTAWALARRPGFVALVDGPPALARTLFVVRSLAVAVQLAWLAPFIIDRTTRRGSRRRCRRCRRRIRACRLTEWPAAACRRGLTSTTNSYSLPQADPTAMRNPHKLGRLSMDNYEYPPPFLIAPRLLGLVTPDFWASAGSGSR
jgi:hypothetical protein